MKVELIFFDNLDNTKNATLRALTAIAIMIIADIIYWSISHTNQKPIKNKWAVPHISFILSWIAIGIAIGISTPQSKSDATTYGTIMGIIIYLFTNAWFYSLVPNYSTTLILMNTCYGIITLSAISLFVHLVAENYDINT